MFRANIVRVEKKTVLGRISKRGNKYMRALFIQAAHVILMRPKNWVKCSSVQWLTEAATPLNRIKLATALANKCYLAGPLCAPRRLARIVWSFLVNQQKFDTSKDKVTAI